MNRSGLRRLGWGTYSPIGLDIGPTSVKMAQLKRTAGGWAISDMLEKEISLSKDEQGEHRSETLVTIIKKCMKESSFSGRSVVSAMPGYQLDILPVKLSLSRDESVEDAILEKARAHLSYDVEHAVIDYLPVEDGEAGTEKDHPTRSILISARREDVDNHLSILKRVKLKPVALDIAACALARLIRFSRAEKDNNVLVIDAGTRHTSLTLLWKNNVLLDRTIRWGREHVIASLMKRLKLDRQKADRLLSRTGLPGGQSAGPEEGNGEHPRKGSPSDVVYEIVSSQLEFLSAEIDKVLQYLSSEMMGAVIDVLYIMGAASTIKDIDTCLEKRTAIPAKLLNPAITLTPGQDERSGDICEKGAVFGVPLGLALRGLG